MSFSSSLGLRSLARSHDSKQSHSKWLMCFEANEKTAAKAICFPHAGCGAAAFKSLAGNLFAGRDMRVVQYPGRETRLREPFFHEMHQLVEEIVKALLPELNEPYVLFGHSMGSKVAYEVLLRLQAQNQRLPEKLVISCSPAPHCPSGLNRAFQQDDRDFLDYLKRLGGVPDELLAIPDLLDMVLPILRADFELLYRYHGSANAEKIQCPLYGIGSAQDASVSEEAVLRWQELAGNGFGYAGVAGGHFYFPYLTKRLDELFKPDD